MPIFMDVSRKYADMIEAFSDDFEVSKNNHISYLNLLQDEIHNKNERVISDIKLLKELSIKLRNGKVKIVESEVKNNE